MAGLEGARRRADFKRGQNGCIYFEIAESVEIGAYFLYDFGARDESFAHFGIDYEV